MVEGDTESNFFFPSESRSMVFSLLLWPGTTLRDFLFLREGNGKKEEITWNICMFVS